MTDVHSYTNPATVVTTTHHDHGHRMSWGAILAGLVSALALMLVLSVLGMAIGLSNVDTNDNARNYGLGVGIWGGISALIAFFFGGWMAAWAKPRNFSGSGVLQGALTWMVSIVLLAYVLAGGIGAVARTAGSAAATGVQAIGATAGGAAQNPEIKQDMQSTTQQAADQLKTKADEVKQQVAPDKVEKAADTAAKGAWGVLGSLIVTLLASLVGGYVGGKRDHHHATTRIVS